MKKIALITGATAGFGRAIASKLAEEGYRLIITGRRTDLLQEVKTELEIKFKAEVLPLCFDVRVFQEVEDALLNSLPARWKDIDVLINNAGLAVGLSPIHEGVIDDWDRMIDTNIKGLLYVTRVVTPRMVERKSGHIINLASIAAKDSYLNGNVYCATKFAVDALSKGMRLDLLPYGIKVTQICPGAAETEFSMVRFKGDQGRSNKVYEGYTPLKAEDVANTVSFALNQPPHVDIQDLLIMSTAQATGTIFHKE